MEATKIRCVLGLGLKIKWSVWGSGPLVSRSFRWVCVKFARYM